MKVLYICNIKLSSMFDKKPFMRGSWTDLIIVNFSCPPSVLEKFLPDDVEPDLWMGQSVFSMVAFTFSKAKMYSLKAYFHQHFGEINFRCYVKSKITKKKGVVFLRELAAKRFMAFIANKFYNEPFHYHLVSRVEGNSSSENIKYTFQTENGKGLIEVKKSSNLRFPEVNTLEYFILERYVAFVKKRNKMSHEYIIKHIPWKFISLRKFENSNLLCELLPGMPSEYLKIPISAYLVDGSDIEVFR